MSVISMDDSLPKPLRGELRIKDRMEMLQDAYFRAVVAAAGCTMSKPDPDNGIDWQLTHESSRHVEDPEVELKVQLKSTSTCGPDPQNGFVSVVLDNDRFRMMARKPVTVNRVLVAMILPDNIDEWVTSGHQLFGIRHCCYWVNMAGMKPTGEKSSTVRVPTSQIFDDLSLCDIIARVGAGGAP
jgi:hypothetical protein